jgi:hypothetical protein
MYELGEHSLKMGHTLILFCFGPIQAGFNAIINHHCLSLSS